MSKEELSRYIKLVPSGNWTKDQVFVYRYNGMTYMGLCLLCFGLGLFMLFGSMMNLVSRSWELGFVLLIGSCIFIIMGVGFWNYIQKCVLIFYPGGLVYRNWKGKVFTVTDEEVLGVLSLGLGKNHYFLIKTKEKTISWSVYARRFYEAEREAFKRYPNMNV